MESEKEENEHVTKGTQTLRFLRKQRPIQSTWNANRKIYVKLNGLREEAKVMVISDIRNI